MANLRDFAKSMTIIAEAIGQNVNEVIKHVATNVGVTVVYATPVDTSRARMNWQGSVGTPATDVLAAYPAKPSTSQEGPAIAIASIAAATASYTGQDGGIWITNNLDYIQQLNDGSSSQAPADFVAQAVVAGVQSIPDIKILP